MTAAVLQAAWDRIRAGRGEDARSILIAFLETEPRHAEARRLLGMAFRVLSQPKDAEEAFKSAIQCDRRDPAHQAEYAAFLDAQGRTKEAEKAFRAALALNRHFAPAASGLALLLLDQGRAGEALQTTTPLAADPKTSAAVRAIHARAQQEAGRFDEAEATFRAIATAQPMNVQVQSDLAELVWMRTGDVAQATAAIEAAMAQQPKETILRLVRAKVLTQVGQPEQALAELDAALKDAPDSPALLSARARLSGADGVAFAEKAVAAAPLDREARGLLAQAYLASGQADRAAPLAEALTQEAPLDQFALALQATVWRLLGDARYGALYDYDRVVNTIDLDTPKGWTSLSAYLADLATALQAMHGLKAHPFGQSVRGGSQVTVLGTKDPIVSTLPKALDAPIRDVIARLAASGHPLGARATDAFRYTGMWSVRLRSGGHHDNHVHPQGWLSSACYIELPKLEGQDGWLKLGEPGLKLAEPLLAERFIEPKPGRLVLFPSYMWHGTVPFSAEQPRLSVAFDLVPA